MSLHGDLEDLEDILQASAWNSQQLRSQSQSLPQPQASPYLQRPAGSEVAGVQEDESVGGGQARRELQQREKEDTAGVSAGRFKDGLKGESCSAIVKVRGGRLPPCRWAPRTHMWVKAANFLDSLFNHYDCIVGTTAGLHAVHRSHREHA